MISIDNHPETCPVYIENGGVEPVALFKSLRELHLSTYFEIVISSTTWTIKIFKEG